MATSKKVGGAKKVVGAASGSRKPPKSAIAVNVIENGSVVRTYSEAVHGEDFRVLADEFASKVEGREVVAVEE